jgi:Bacterial protein of unknown function (DUF882)
MRCAKIIAAAALVCGLQGLSLAPTQAQTPSIFDLFRKGAEAVEPNYVPPGSEAEKNEEPPKAADPKSATQRPGPARTQPTPRPGTPAARAAEAKAKEQEPDDEEDDDTFVSNDKPKLVTVALPLRRPGTAAARDDLPTISRSGATGFAPNRETLPPGVNFAGAIRPPTNPALPTTRVASLPQAPNVPSFARADPLRPSSLRDVEQPVAGMPGVFAPPEAVFQCLPVSVKQVLVDTAARFGHVAILNARRGRGTGARESYHYRCRAVDFRVRGVPVRTVYNYLKAHPNVGGRKLYPLGFFHVDDGPVRSW